jgi:hypothetical protein
MLLHISDIQISRRARVSEESPVSEALRKRRLTHSRKLRLLARAAKVQRCEKIFNQLAAGMSVSHIAMQEGVSIRRMREVVQEILAARKADPAAGFAQLQMARLSDAMMVAHTSMMGGNLQAVDRVVKLVHELERYHGSGARTDARFVARLGRPEPPRALPARESIETAENHNVSY